MSRDGERREEAQREEGPLVFIYEVEIYKIDQLSIITVIKKIQTIYTKCIVLRT